MTRLQRGASTLLLATLPAFITLSRSPLSEISGALCIATAFVLFTRALDRGRIDLAFWGCAALGFACNIRLQLLFFSPLMLTALFCGRYTPKRRLANAALASGIFLIAFFPTLYMNYSLFGSPFVTGYHFWVPGSTRSGYTFGIQYVSVQLQMLAQEFVLTPKRFHAANLFGTGAYFTPPVVLLSLVGLLGVKRDRILGPVILSVLTFLAMSLTYFFSDDSRLYFPLFVLMVWVASAPVAEALSTLLEGRIRPGTCAPLVLFLLSVVGTPSMSWWPPQYSWSQLLDLMQMDTMGDHSPEFDAATYAATIVHPGPALILSDVSAPYLSTFLDNEKIVAPVDGHHDYTLSEELHFDARDALRLSQTALQSGVTVLALIRAGRSTSPFVDRLPRLEGTCWKEVKRSRHRLYFAYRAHPVSEAPETTASKDLPVVFLLTKSCDVTNAFHSPTQAMIRR